MALNTQTLREKYIIRLKTGIENQEEVMDGLMDDIYRMEMEIKDTKKPMNPLFTSPENFWAEVDNGNYRALNIVDQAWDLVHHQIFWGDLRNYDLPTIPIIATRSITNLESILHERFVEKIILEEHNDCLENQLDDICYSRCYKNASEYDSDSVVEYDSDYGASPCKNQDGYAPITMDTWDGATGAETVNKEESERLEKLALSEIETMGFPKTKIVADVKSLLIQIQPQLSRQEKIVISRKIFHYLATPYGKKFIKGYERFQKTVEEKLLDFRYNEGLREAGTWWRQIFETRMPLEGETD